VRATIEELWSVLLADEESSLDQLLARGGRQHLRRYRIPRDQAKEIKAVLAKGRREDECASLFYTWFQLGPGQFDDDPVTATGE
jgi:hypothetical protein